jgi:hypothetical protein
LFRGISVFNKGYQPRTNIVEDEKGDLVTDFYSILAKWGNHLSQPFNIYGVSDVRQTLVPEPSDFDIEMDFEKLKDTAH